jgi:hypothetical protein
LNPAFFVGYRGRDDSACQRASFKKSVGVTVSITGQAVVVYCPPRNNAEDAASLLRRIFDIGFPEGQTTWQVFRFSWMSLSVDL